jgi:hypothetical protein
MTLWLSFVAFAAAIGSGALSVAVDGDDNLGAEVATVRARVQQLWGSDVRLTGVEDAPTLRVLLRRVDEGLQVIVLDDDTVVADQIVIGDEDTQQALAWVIVRAAIDRALVDIAAPADDGVDAPGTTPNAPNVATTTTTNTTPEKDGGGAATADAVRRRTGWSGDVRVGLETGGAPFDFVGVGAAVGGGIAFEERWWVRVGLDVGGTAFLGPIIVQALPVTLRGAVGSALDEGRAPAPFVEAWSSVRPGIADAGTTASSTLQVAIGAGSGVRLAGPGATTFFAAAGIEGRLLRSTYPVGDAPLRDGLLSLQLTAGIGVPLAW